MKIVKTVDRELTSGEIASMERFRSYTDGVSFACLRERVMVMLHDEPAREPEKLRAKALEHMDEALSTHPDMDVYDMDDGFRMVCIPGGVFAISAEACEEEGVGMSLNLRGECLEACEDGEVIAVAYEED